MLFRASTDSTDNIPTQTHFTLAPSVHQLSFHMRSVRDQFYTLSKLARQHSGQYDIIGDQSFTLDLFVHHPSFSYEIIWDPLVSEHFCSYESFPPFIRFHLTIKRKSRVFMLLHIFIYSFIFCWQVCFARLIYNAAISAPLPF